MHIPAGAFNQASNNDPVLEFNCTFRYDATLLAVTTPFHRTAVPSIRQGRLPIRMI